MNYPKLVFKDIKPLLFLPTELNDTFDSLEYEENGRLNGYRHSFEGNTLQFDFKLFFIGRGGRQPQDPEYWRLTVKTCRDFHFNNHLQHFDRCFKFYTEHYLLWEYNAPETELYFHKRPEAPALLLADIFNLHYTVFEGFIPLERFITCKQFLASAELRFGMFAKGPNPLLQYYHELLEKHGAAPYYLDCPPKIGMGDKPIQLAKLGMSYFIGEEFIFGRL